MINNGLITFFGFIFLIVSSVATSGEQKNPLLRYVPEQTLFFSGNTQRFNLNDYPFFAISHSFDTTLSEPEREALGVEFVFLYELYQDLEATLFQGNAKLQSHYGFTEEIAMAFYTIGVTPVIKFTIEDEQAFLNVLLEAEKKSGFKHQEAVYENKHYWSYPFDPQLQLIVAIQKTDRHEKVATIALLNNASNEKQKQLVFGMTLPDKSVEDKVKTIEKENQYLPLLVSFIDFREVLGSLFYSGTPSDKNSWTEWLGDNNQVIEAFQASNCELDVMNLAHQMPQIVTGYKKYQTQDKTISVDFEALLELKNQNFKTELEHFRGFIPNYIRNGAENNLLAFGLGANFSQLSPFFVYVSKTLRESTFQCEQLKEIQKNVAEMNPLMLAMFAGVVEGVYGVSFAVQDFSLIETGHQNKKNIKLSSIMSLSADNPLKVWQMLAAFIPETALIVPNETPQKFSLPLLEEMGLELFISIKGQHLVLYSGDKAEEIGQSLLNETIESNGFFQETLNYTYLTQAVRDLRQYLAESEHQQEQLPSEACLYFDESIAILSRFSGFIDYKNDFVNRGWLNVLNIDVELNPIADMEYHLPGNYETYFVQDGCQLAKDGLEVVHEDGTGFYQQYSDDGQCFIFETRYRWTQTDQKMKFQYVSERSRPEGSCTSNFDSWAIPQAEYINDTCQLRTETDGSFSCLYQWDGVLTKSVYKKI
ncbi:MAG: hypothetical protein GY694_15670 [Gammaproteobacteria bacterium]|nr:hypothetical protein [Gammaproteobacteria bacterium]